MARGFSRFIPKLARSFTRGGGRGAPRVTTGQGRSSRMAGSRQVPRSSRTAAQRSSQPPAPPRGSNTGGGGLIGGGLRFAGNLVGPTLAVGTVLSAPSILQDFARGMKRDILEAGPQDGSDFTPNFFQELVTGMDADDYRAQYDRENLDELLKRGEVAERIAAGAAAPVLGEDFAEYIGRTNPQYKKLLDDDAIEKETAAARRAFMSPQNQYNMAQLQGQLEREYGLTKRQLEAGIRQAEGQLELQEMQLLNARQDAQQQMALLNYKEANRAEEAAYRNRLELMQGLSALAMGAFI